MDTEYAAQRHRARREYRAAIAYRGALTPSALDERLRASDGRFASRAMPLAERAKPEPRASDVRDIGDWIDQSELADFGDLGGEGDDWSVVGARIQLSTAHRCNDDAARFASGWGGRSMLDGGVLDPMKAGRLAHRMAQLWREAERRRLGEGRGLDGGSRLAIQGAVKNHGFPLERGMGARFSLQAARPPSCLSCATPLTDASAPLCHRCQDERDASLAAVRRHAEPSARSFSDNAPAPLGAGEPASARASGQFSCGDKAAKRSENAGHERSADSRASRLRLAFWLVALLVVCAALAASACVSNVGRMSPKEGPSHAGK